jgi:serine protease Do
MFIRKLFFRTLLLFILSLYANVSTVGAQTNSVNPYFELSYPINSVSERDTVTVHYAYNTQHFKQEPYIIMRNGDGKELKWFFSVITNHLPVFESAMDKELRKVFYDHKLTDSSENIFRNPLTTFKITAEIQKFKANWVSKMNWQYEVNFETRVKFKIYDDYNVVIDSIVSEKVSAVKKYKAYIKYSSKKAIAQRAEINGNVDSTAWRVCTDLVNSGRFKALVSDIRKNDTSDISENKNIVLKSGNGGVKKIGEAVKSVVTVKTSHGHGSGCIVSSDGYLITNYHVIAGEKTIKIWNDSVDTLNAQVVKTDRLLDLALLKVESASLVPLKIGKEEVSPGMDVFAIGTPASVQLGQTVSKGAVSSLREFSGIKKIQVDVKVNPGNSGGALLSKDGNVIGVICSKYVGADIEGIGFAIPIADAVRSFKLIEE